MINFILIEPDGLLRLNKEYLACIIIIEKIISGLKTSSELNYSFNFVENGIEPPSIEINHARDLKYTFDAIIVSETNKLLKNIFKELDTKSNNINTITNDVKNRLKENIENKGFKGKTFNLEQALDTLTPFSQENNITTRFVIKDELKLMVLLMAIYSRCIHLEVVSDVLNQLKNEVFSV